WVRVVAGDVGRVPVGGLGPVFWDADDTTANNTPEQPGWGRVPAEGFPAAAYPPGAYRFYSALGDGGAGDPTRSAASAPLHVLARPSVAVLDPDRAGGEDHITALTGDPWDFSQPTDAVVGNARDVTVADGVLSATNTSNDPYVDLRLGPTPIDPTRYHR